MEKLSEKESNNITEGDEKEEEMECLSSECDGKEGQNKTDGPSASGTDDDLIRQLEAKNDSHLIQIKASSAEVF